MAIGSLSEILSVSTDPAVGEIGGSHNQKGVEYQRNWAVVQMLVLEEGGASDFLFLFESIQDIAILDSAENPTNIKLFQLKKKDRGEWSWAGLTRLHEPADPAKRKKKISTPKPLNDVATSPIGKLHAAIHAFSVLTSSGRFISNAGCDLSMADGSNAATSLSVALDALPDHFRILLNDALTTMHKQGESPPDLSKITLEKSDIPVEDTSIYTVGRAHDFFVKRSPKHAGQARSFVDSLLAKIGPLGGKTDKCSNFEEIKSQHGYSRRDFAIALSALESIVDVDFFLDAWLIQLQQEGMGFLEIARIRAAVASIYRRQVLGERLPQEESVISACDSWLLDQPDPPMLLPFFRAALAHLTAKFPLVKSEELQAHFALRAINKCVDLN
ncbi:MULTISPECIES: dsDNA nuclease domain-containing protein [Methylobacterium]|uniref:dsDNA nuclease domain-containing protein n=1 Tax=Methylobacterium TaxID=407 RepID=UPI0013ED3E18|nr:dsDNA nuclease domain-containing protein [Methylobacterium sp. DB0501]NGM32689.1 DUF4297 domain-containing protein [Methylobacterium sp. DB0501]